MDKEIRQRSAYLLEHTRVMTLAVCHEQIPWSSPVYFVFLDGRFCFFSNENTRHVRYAAGGRSTAASIFHDSDKISEIFGFQMAGSVMPVSGPGAYLRTVKAYITKFGFLKEVFGPQIIENSSFFMETFNASLYAFVPERIFLSDNSKTTGKRVEILLADLNAL